MEVWQGHRTIGPLLPVVLGHQPWARSWVHALVHRTRI